MLSILHEPQVMSKWSLQDPVHYGTNMVAIGLKHGHHHVMIRLLWTEDGKHGADIEGKAICDADCYMIVIAILLASCSNCQQQGYWA